MTAQGAHTVPLQFSENVFQRKLHDPRTAVTAGDPAQLAAAQCHIGRTKPKTIRYIECLCAKLHLLTFSNLKLPRYRLGPIPESWPSQASHRQVAVSPNCK